jgi:ribosomal protein L16 Arg81 hydroxylase
MRTVAAAAPRLLLIALALSVLHPAGSRRSKTAKRAGGCARPWEETKPGHVFDKSDVDELTPEELTPELFAEKYSLRRPLIIRNASDNAAARRFLANRCDIIERFGDVKVDLGDPFSLVVHGRATSSMSLREYLDTPFDLKAPRYFFDRLGHWMEHLGELNELLESPGSVQLQPADAAAPIIFAIGKTASGIGLHAHQDAWNQVLFGAKRWTLYPGSPGGVPKEAGYNPTEPHLSWLHDVYPKVKDDDATKPMECIQYAGDVIYVPEGWYHATVNLGDTGAIARRTEEFTPGSSRELGGRAIKAVMSQRHDAAVSLAEQAQEIDPKEGDHAINMGHALDGAGRRSEAKAAFQRAVELMPRNPGSYLTLGKLLNEMGEYGAAGGSLSRGRGLVSAAGEDNPLAQALKDELSKSRKARAEQKAQRQGGEL